MTREIYEAHVRAVDGLIRLQEERFDDGREPAPARTQPSSLFMMFEPPGRSNPSTGAFPDPPLAVPDSSKELVESCLGEAELWVRHSKCFRSRWETTSRVSNTS